MRTVLRSDHGNSVAILGAEATEHVENLGGLTQRLTDVAQSVSELLDVAGVRRDVHVALDQAPELCGEFHCP